LMQTVDIMPTILDILGIRAPDHMQGRSMVPLMDKGKELNRYIFGGTRYWSSDLYRYVSLNEYIRDSEWKLIHEARTGTDRYFASAKGEKKDILRHRWHEESGIEYDDLYSEEDFRLYNIAEDPGETEDLLYANERVYKRMKSRLLKWHKKTVRFDTENMSKRIFSPEDMKKIRKAGYWE